MSLQFCTVSEKFLVFRLFWMSIRAASYALHFLLTRDLYRLARGSATYFK